MGRHLPGAGTEVTEGPEIAEITAVRIGGTRAVESHCIPCRAFIRTARVGHRRRYRKSTLLPVLRAAGFAVERASYVDSIGFAAGLAPGDDTAWRDFVDLYTPLVYGYCRRCGCECQQHRDCGYETYLLHDSNLSCHWPGVF